MIDASPQRASESPAVDVDSPRRGLVLALLCVVAVFNMVDRQIITIVLEPIKEEFGASDTAMGLLTGLIFAVFYAAAAIPLARWADRGERRIVMAVCLGFWSLMTTLGGVAQSFVLLALTRIGVAIGEAGASPTSQSMLADLYPLRSRATVMATLSSFQSIGIGLGVLLGGWLSDSLGWRASFFIVGIPGVLLAFVILFWLREPARGAVEGLVDEPSDAGFGEVFGLLARISTYRCLVGIAAFVALCGYGSLMWGPTFFRRVHGLSGTDTGLVFGVATIVALVLGNMAAGLVADRAGDRDLRWYMRVAAIGPALGFPCGLVFVFAEQTGTALLGYLFFQLFITFHIPPVYAIAQTLAPLRMRATAMVVIGLFQTSVGIGLAPLLIGGVNDALEPRMGVEAIRYSLGLVMVGALIASLIAFRATFSIERDYELSRGQHAGE
jgi:MFS family permease